MAVGMLTCPEHAFNFLQAVIQVPALMQSSKTSLVGALSASTAHLVGSLVSMDARALATLLAITPQFVWEADPEGSITGSSQFGLDYMGLSLAQVQGDGWLQAVEPADHARVLAAWRAALAEGNRYEVEMPIRRASDGRYRTHLVRAEPVRDAGGLVSRWIGIAFDVHDARVAHSALADRDARLASIGEATAGFFYMKDENGRIVWCNRAVLAALGRPAGDVIGRTARQIIGPGAPADAIEANDRQVMASGHPLVFEEHLADPLRTYTSTKAPWRDATGRIVGVICVSVDITALRRTESALAESRAQLREREARLAVVLAVAGQRAWSYLVEEGAFVLVGQSHGEPVFGSEKWLTREQAWRGVHPGDAERLNRALERCVAGQGDFDETYRLLRPDGEVRWLRSVGRCVTAAAGQGEASTRVHGVTMDLTDERRSQAALEDSEQRLRLAVSSSSLGWWDFDPQSRELNLSVNAQRMFGFDDAEPVHLDMPVGRIHADERSRVVASMDAATDPAGDGSYAEHYRVIWPDGSVRWIQAVGQVDFEVLPSGARVARRFSGVLWDVTEQQRTSAALAESEQRFRLIADTMPQIVWATRPDGYHDYFNERWYDYTGMPRPHQPSGEHDPAGTGQGWNWKDYLHPDDQAATFAAWSRSLTTGEAYNVEYRFKRHDGQYRWFIGQALPLRNGHGQITRWFGTLTDVHDQTLAAQEREGLIEQLRASEAKLRALFEAAPVGIVMADAPHGAITGGNRRAEEIFRHPIHRSTGVEAYGEWVAFHADGTRVEPSDYPLARVLQRGEDRAAAEYLYQRGDGSTAWVRFVAAPVRDEASGQLLGGVVATLDIDAERRALETLREADRAKDEFLAMLAHELRNPLAPVLNATKVLARRETLSAPGMQALAMIERQATHMQRLVDDLLEVNRIKRGLVQLQPEPMLLTTAVAEVVETVLPALEARGQTLDVVQPTRPVKIHADPVRIAQVIENLLTNASKYTPRGGAIRVELRADQGEAVLSVSDNGIGIEADKLEAVFELFMQGDPNADGHKGGLGIGLAMVRRLVELHGGHVRAQSSGRGHGSTFTVRLPMQPR